VFFSTEVVEKYKQVMRAPLSIENVPNIEFEEKRDAFMKAAAQELQLNKV
jgi:hypothetical protein